nr:unnamed protein product [Digitaria exilis]
MGRPFPWLNPQIAKEDEMDVMELGKDERRKTACDRRSDRLCPERQMILLSVEELFGRSLFQLLLLKLGLFQPLLTSTSLLLPLRRRSATFTNFPLLTTPWMLAGDA